MPETLELLTEETKDLEPVVTPEGADSTLTYASDNTAIATVDDKGTVKGIAAGTAVITATSVQNPEVTAKCAVTVKPAEVESVTAVNAKQIKVTFNKELDKTSAETISNYAITPANDDARATITITASTGAKLQDDKKSVLLDIEGTPLNSKANAKYFVKVSGVKEYKGESVKEYSEVVSLSDLEAVKVSEVSFSDANTLRVKFTEPINTISSGVASAIKFKLDGINVSVSSTAYTLSTDKTYVDIDVAAAGLESTKTYTVVVDGLTDFASNAIAKYETTITISKDEVKPTVESITVLSQSYIKVVFSEKIKNTTTGFKVNVDGTDRTSAVTDENTTKPDGKSFIVNLGTTITEGNHVVTVYNFSDVANNAGLSVSKEYKFAASKPVLTSETAEIKDISGSKYAVFTFDRNVKRNAITQVSATYVDKNGITKTIKLNVAGNAEVTGLEKTQIGLDITSAEEGTYSFKFAKGNIVDEYAQQADEMKLSFVRSAETVKTTVASVQSNIVAGTNDLEKVTVTFAANVDDDALDVTHYTIDGIQAFEKAIFDGDKKTVTLTLKSGALTTTGTKTIKVTGVKNVTDYANTASFRENVKPVVAKAELIAYDKIRLTFSEAVKASVIDGTDLEVFVDGVKTKSAITVAGKNSDTLVITLNATDKLTSSATPVKVSILATNDLADATGNKVDAADITNVTVNFVDVELNYTNAVTALETAINKDLTTSSNLAAANKALTEAQTAQTAANTSDAGYDAKAAKVASAAEVVAKIDDYNTAKTNATNKAAATTDATSTQLTEAQTAIDDIAAAGSAVSSVAGTLTITNLTTAITADTTAAENKNKATVKTNMNAKFAVTVTADQDGTGKGKFTITAPWLTDSDLYDPTKFTFTCDTNSEVVADSTTGLKVQLDEITDITSSATVKVKPLATGILEQYFGADKEYTLTLTPVGGAPSANAPIKIASIQ